MRLICTQENFKKAIFNSERLVSKQTTLPILNNLLFEAEKNKLKLSATNLEMGVLVQIGAKVEKEGKITVPARLLSNFINNLTGGENVEIESNEQVLKIKNGTSKATIKGLSATDFPLLPQKKADFQLRLNSRTLKEIISRVAVAVAFNEARQELTGINVLLGSKELFFAATDSFRLAECRLGITEKNANKEAYQALISKKESVIIPAATLLELARIIPEDEEKEIKIAIEESQIFFECAGTSLVSRLINGKYPDYKHIVPKDFQTRAVVEKGGMQSVVKVASIFSSGKTSEVGVEVDPGKKKITVFGQSAEVGENTSEIKADITGPKQKITFNARYVLDGLNSIASPQVAVLINNGSAPAALQEINEKTGEVLKDYIYIVMPIKN